MIINSSKAVGHKLTSIFYFLEFMKTRVKPITIHIFQRFALIAFGVIFVISASSHAYAEPVRKDAALTHRYLELRSALSKDKEEKSEGAAQTVEGEGSSESVMQDFDLSSGSSSSALDFFRKHKPASETWVDPWKVDARLASTPKKEPTLEMVTPYLEALRRWKDSPFTIEPRDLYRMRDSKPGKKEKGLVLPLNSTLQITGHKSVTVEMNHTHYFGQGDINRFGGSYQGGLGSGLDLGLTSSYSNDSYGDFGGGFGGGYGGAGYGGGYGSGFGGFGTTRFGGVPRASGPTIRQTLQVGLHGRVGKHTHVEVDYSDSGDALGGGYGGYGGYSGGFGGAKEQKIRVWYEGGQDSILKTLSFGDITLNLPNTRFLNVNRNLFGLEAVAALGDVKMTAFGSRSKGISETRRFSGKSRRAGSGYGGGVQISDANYVKERFYSISLGRRWFTSRFLS